jgi:hypothetical protein
VDQPVEPLRHVLDECDPARVAQAGAPVADHVDQQRQLLHRRQGRRRVDVQLAPRRIVQRVADEDLGVVHEPVDSALRDSVIATHEVLLR